MTDSESQYSSPQMIADLSELARLLLEREAQIEVLEAENARLEGALVRAERISEQGDGIAEPEQHQPRTDPAALRRLEAVVAEKERARFDLETRVQAMAEALAVLDDLLAEPAGPRQADAQTAEIVRLTGMLREAEAMLRDREEEIVALHRDTQKLRDVAPQVGASTGPGAQDLTEIRRAMTQLLAERDRTVMAGLAG